MSAKATIRENILAVFDTLSRKQRQLARFFLENEDIVAFASANDIGERVGTSAATVVRFCRALGYEGYTDLQAAIRTGFPQYQTVVQKMAARIANGNQLDELPVQIAAANIQNIQVTLNQISQDTLAAVANAIVQARHIYIFAGGLSSAVAVMAEHALISLGFSARACLNGRGNQALQLAQTTPQDLVIVISIWRYLSDTVDAATAARTAGATCIALTDSPVAPAAGIADHVLVAATEGATHSHSLTGLISLVDLISAAIAAQRPAESMAALRRIDQIYREYGVLMSE